MHEEGLGNPQWYHRKAVLHDNLIHGLGVRAPKR